MSWTLVGACLPSKLKPVEGPTMAYYLLQTAYTPQGWAAMQGNPHDRLEAIKPSVERLGGSIVDGWLSFGEYDVVLICSLPNNVTAAALSIAISSGGAAKAVRTTPLISFSEGIDALHQATEAAYAPPPSDFPYFGA